MELRENKIFLERVKNETEMYRSISENYDKQRKKRTWIPKSYAGNLWFAEK